MYYWTPQRLKELKAKGYKLHSCPEAKVTSSKHQAASSKRQAPSNPAGTAEAASAKLQASSTKLI